MIKQLVKVFTYFIAAFLIIGYGYILMSLLNNISKTEHFKTPIQMFESLEKGADTDQMSDEISDETARTTKAQEYQEIQDANKEIIPLPEEDKELTEMEDIDESFYGITDSGRSGKLLAVKSQSGDKVVSHKNGWVISNSENGKEMIEKEDRDGFGNVFTQNYAMWKCSKLEDCVGVIFKKDGTKFGLYSKFNEATIDGGKGQFKIEPPTGTSTEIIEVRSGTVGSKKIPVGWDLFIRENTKKIAAASQIDNMPSGISPWGSDRDEMIQVAAGDCTENNPGTDWNKFSCVNVGCVRKENKLGERRYQCKARPKSTI